MPTTKLDISGTGKTTEASLGSELLTNGTFTGDASDWTSGGSAIPANNWTYNSNNVMHSSGATTALTQSLGSLAAGKYKSNSQYTHGQLIITPNLKGINGYGVYDNNTTIKQYITIAAGITEINFIPTSDFNGIIDDVSVMQVNQTEALQVLRNSDNSIGLEVRSGGSSYYNTFVGVDAGMYSLNNGSSSGKYNSALGYNALKNNTEGRYNTASGYYSLYSNTTGQYNTATGVNSLRSNIAGYSNTAIGYNSLYSNTNGYENTAFGYNSLYSNTNGYSNTAFGYNSLYSNTTGYNNVAIGDQSLQANLSGYRNIAQELLLGIT